MLPIILLGVGLAAMALDSLFDDNDSDAAPTDVEDTPVRNEDTLIGTDGDDSFGEDVSGDDEISEIRGGAGDDTFVGLDGTRAFGEEGDDTFLISEETAGYNVVLDGGDGNDTLSALGVTRATLDGGTGDDLITLKHDIFGEEASSAHGGEGNDTLNVQLDLSPDLNVSNPTVSGGAGEDEFYLTVTPVTDSSGPLAEAANRLVTVTDFDPDEDALVLDLSQEELPEAFSDVEIEITYEDEEAQIVLTYQGTPPP